MCVVLCASCICVALVGTNVCSLVLVGTNVCSPMCFLYLGCVGGN